MTFIALERLINLHEGYRKVFTVNHQKLLLIEEQGRRYVVQASCPHQHWSLETSPVNEGVIQCQKHGLSFYLQDGRPLESNTMSCNALSCFDIAYRGTEVGIYLEH